MVAANPHVKPTRQDSFRSALRGVLRRTRAKMGDEDLKSIRRLNRVSRAAEVLGRGLIHFSIGPVGFSAGVVSLWVHKQLQTTAIGHPVLHGAFDNLEGVGSLHSRKYRWGAPIDEEAWDHGHNRAHHTHTNVEHKDVDMNFGPVRLTARTPHRAIHYLQVPYTVALMWPFFTFSMNVHFSGHAGGWGKRSVWMAARKAVPHYAKDFLLFPALAGPFWWKVAAGNAAAELLTNVFTAATIFCGHIGEDVAHYPADTRAPSPGAWYEMQVRTAQNFEVPWLLSVLCGGLDHQIEHHLFPTLPPDRLREIAPEVRKICAEHGVPYNTGSWPRVLGGAFKHLWTLSFPSNGAVALG